MRRRRLFAMFTTLIVALILGGTATPARAQSEIWVHIVNIWSLKIDDAVGYDEPYFKFNGNKQSWTTAGNPQSWQGDGFSAGHSEDVDIWYLVNVNGNSQGTLELWEADEWPSRDDRISSHIVYASDVGSGLKTIEMGYKAGNPPDWRVYYVVQYEVVYA